MVILEMYAPLLSDEYEQLHGGKHYFQHIYLHQQQQHGTDYYPI